MAITKTWEVNTLQREVADGYVNKVIYRVNGTDGTYKTRATGEVDLPKPDTLVPYGDLTEATVLGWVKAKLDADNAGTVAQIEAAIDANVNEQKTPTTAVGIPWSQSHMALTQSSEGGLKISNAGTNGQYLQKQSGNTGGLTWADVPAGVGGATGVDFNDTVKARFGTGDDLEIHHTSHHSYIKNTTGNLVISDTDGDIWIQAKDGEHSIIAHADGSVKLYHNGTAKVETTAAGATVTGDFNATGNLVLHDSSGGGNNRIVFGAGADLNIYSDGSTSLIEGNDIRIRNANGDENLATFTNGGAVELYYNNAKKFETNQYGCKSIQHMYFDDSHKVQLGNSQDLEIYHSGTYSYIKNSNANGLWVASDLTSLTNAAVTENLAKFTANGSVELCYDGTKKLETTSTGVTVDGNLVLGDGQQIQFGSNDLRIYHSASTGDSYIEGTSRDIVIRTTTGHFVELKTNDETAVKCNANSSVELYYNNVKKFETQNTGCKVGGNLTVDGDILPNSTNSKDLGAGTARFQECHSAYWIHRYGSSGSVTQNEQEAIYIAGGVHFFGDYITMSNGNFSNGITGNRSYPMLAVHQDGSGAAIHAEDGAITEASDYRIKENVATLGSGIDKVKALKPITYTLKKSWKPNGKGEVYHGFIAHEVGETLSGITGIVCGEKDAMAPELYSIQDEKEGKIPDGKKIMDETGNTTTDMMIQSVDYGKLTPILTAALKEAIAKIETLETKVAALEG